MDFFQEVFPFYLSLSFLPSSFAFFACLPRELYSLQEMPPASSSLPRLPASLTTCQRPSFRVVLEILQDMMLPPYERFDSLTDDASFPPFSRYSSSGVFFSEFRLSMFLPIEMPIPLSSSGCFPLFVIPLPPAVCTFPGSRPETALVRARAFFSKYVHSLPPPG